MILSLVRKTGVKFRYGEFLLIFVCVSAFFKLKGVVGKFKDHAIFSILNSSRSLVNRLDRIFRRPARLHEFIALTRKHDQGVMSSILTFFVHFSSCSLLGYLTHSRISPAPRRSSLAHYLRIHTSVQRIS